MSDNKDLKLIAEELEGWSKRVEEKLAKRAERKKDFVNTSRIPIKRLYTPLEIEGRDIYIREGCVSCHTQMVRPFRDETLRYQGEYSTAGEFVYDHPFLWGSKRTGPDLHRVGKKYLDSWHYQHMLDPTSMSPGSLMPSYPWLFDQTVDAEGVPDKINAMRKIGVPYQQGYETIEAVNGQEADVSKRAEVHGPHHPDRPAAG